MKLALRMYEDSLCSCGHSSFLAHGPEGHDEYEADSVKCHACAEGERARERDSSPAPGTKMFVKDLHDDPRDDEPDGED